ncbi:2,3-bisphosphoglycerate-independent phosphoglycerate mutase [Candidatus Saccharibacteria bacterium]|nr:2,3-bisphosphoglycerate-independent phosphoglycerate mutase [Candidatus Saccharibacteria bacterium]
MKTRQYILMIFDGLGLNDDATGNAFYHARTPNFDKIFKTYPNSHIKTSGLAVGLPDGQMGNSEVGHTNIGAGRVVYQELTRISKAVNDGDFFDNIALKEVMDSARGGALHLMGLVSDGGIHSHFDHLVALIKMAKNSDVKNVFVHAFLDGRDVAPDSGLKYIDDLEAKLKNIGVGRIASIGGRYYGMDRDSRWDRVKLAYDSIANGIGASADSAHQAIQESYDNKIFDEFVVPTTILNKAGRADCIKDGDAVIFFNFRPDRARQITRTFVDDEFDGFDRRKISNLNFVTMTEYDSTIKTQVAYSPQVISNTFGEYVSSLGYTQLRIAETEKYAHVTFFFNGGEEGQYKGEDRILVPSPKVATYDLQPEMSAREVTEKVIEAIDSKKYDVIIMNYANGDMVGHTGMMDKAIEAVEVLDECLGKVLDSLVKVDGEAIITADHGNCEYMIDPTNDNVITSHSTFDVPIVVVSNRVKEVESGSLCDLMPTMLDLMGESIPTEMTGKSLIIKKKEKNNE